MTWLPSTVLTGRTISQQSDASCVTVFNSSSTFSTKTPVRLWQTPVKFSCHQNYRGSYEINVPCLTPASAIKRFLSVNNNWTAELWIATAELCYWIQFNSSLTFSTNIDIHHQTVDHCWPHRPREIVFWRTQESGGTERFFRDLLCNSDGKRTLPEFGKASPERLHIVPLFAVCTPTDLQLFSSFITRSEMFEKRSSCVFQYHPQRGVRWYPLRLYTLIG